MHDIAIPTLYLTLCQICDRFNKFQAILAQLSSNLCTRTVGDFQLCIWGLLFKVAKRKYDIHAYLSMC